MADPENFGGGDLKHKTSKIRMSSPKLRAIFRPKSEYQTIFSPKIRWSPKKKKKKKVFTKIESVFFGRNRNFKQFFRPKSGGLQTKKKKVFTKIESDFSAGFVKFRLVGGDASRNGAELFEIEAVFSAKIVTFRLVGGDTSPPSPPPPKSATAYALMKLRSENLRKLRTAITNRPLRPQLIICLKKCSFLCFFCKTRANTLQVLPVQTAGLYRYDE